MIVYFLFTGKGCTDGFGCISSFFREKDVRDHLKAVYGTLSVGLAAAAIGAALHILTDMFRSSFLLSLAPIGLMIALCTTPHSAENERKRFFYFLGFTCLTGMYLCSFSYFSHCCLEFLRG